MSTDFNNSAIEANANEQTAQLKTAADLYHYLDDLFEQDADSDTLFAGGYLRGLSSLVATDFGDENQALTAKLVESITAKISQSKSELTPQDYAIVTNFWLLVQTKIAN
ncbi:YfcL family protein [Colwellia echini]|uniref:YfcL family protein n=1 Tax=Colwellia echini TaxID=1982103 RepID=A0ABY3MZM0_9GAMM|nr:YfcL family protein [Colwellia echini]TYK66462.1 YfcL family protein [Colwellia echini]